MLNTKQVVSLCKEHGFSLVGVADARKSKWSTEFEQWLHGGKHGEMAWLANNVSLRLDPTLFVEGAKSVICVADRYGGAEDEPLPPRHGRIARYARGSDYHKVMKKRLHTVCDVLRAIDESFIFRVCVDTAPLFEREFAAASGIGASRNARLSTTTIGESHAGRATSPNSRDVAAGVRRGLSPRTAGATPGLFSKLPSRHYGLSAARKLAGLEHRVSG